MMLSWQKRAFIVLEVPGSKSPSSWLFSSSHSSSSLFSFFPVSFHSLYYLLLAFSHCLFILCSWFRFVLTFRHSCFPLLYICMMATLFHCFMPTCIASYSRCPLFYNRKISFFLQLFFFVSCFSTAFLQDLLEKQKYKQNTSLQNKNKIRSFDSFPRKQQKLHHRNR